MPVATEPVPQTSSEGEVRYLADVPASAMKGLVASTPRGFGRLERLLQQLQFRIKADATHTAYSGDRDRCRRFFREARLAKAGYDLVSGLLPDERILLLFVLWGTIIKGWKLSTMRRSLRGVQDAFKRRGVDFPMDFRSEEKFFKSLRRFLYESPEYRRLTEVTRKRRFSNSLYAKMLAACDVRTPHGARNHAILTNLIEGCFRRSELVALDVHHRKRDKRGHIYVLTRSKTNQDGHVEYVPMKCVPDPSCPVCSADRWLRMAKITSGAIYRGIDRWGHLNDKALTGTAIALIIKDILRDIGLSEDEVAHYSGHSGRRTGINRRLDARQSPLVVKRRARIKSDSTLETYVEDPYYWLDQDAA
ncbi:MAG: hypothetical protein ABSE64_08025 [Vulcanimicrobiaceae bacterium]|jgi:hypothetical protein